MAIFERIVRDPEIRGGQPTFKGTRVMVWIVFECIKAGMPFSEILEEYPSITQDDIDAAFDYVVKILQKTRR